MAVGSYDVLVLSRGGHEAAGISQRSGGAMASPIVGPHAARAQERGRMARIGVLWHAGNAEEEGEYVPLLGRADEVIE